MTLYPGGRRSSDFPDRPRQRRGYRHEHRCPIANGVSDEKAGTPTKLGHRPTRSSDTDQTFRDTRRRVAYQDDGISFEDSLEFAYEDVLERDA